MENQIQSSIEPQPIPQQESPTAGPIPEKPKSNNKLFLIIIIIILITAIIGVSLFFILKQEKTPNHQENHSIKEEGEPAQKEEDTPETPPQTEETQKVEIIFQIYDDTTKSYIDVFKESIALGSKTADYIPTVPDRNYYKWDQTWTPKLEETVSTSKIYQANYIPKNDENKNGIADETEKKYTITYYKDNKCQEVYKQFKNVVEGTVTPIPSSPTRQYYKFHSWYPSSANKIVNSNAKYCAVWQPINDQNGDNIADEEQTSLTPSKLTIEDLNLTTTDSKNYTFTYSNETYNAIYTTDNWKIVNSYKITIKEDMIIICSALIEKHQVHGKDMVSYRTAEDMAYEWEQHNLLYYMLPEGHELKDNARDVDLNPSDQGKSLQEMYEDRLGTMF